MLTESLQKVPNQHEVTTALMNEEHKAAKKGSSMRFEEQRVAKVGCKTSVRTTSHSPTAANQSQNQKDIRHWMKKSPEWGDAAERGEIVSKDKEPTVRTGTGRFDDRSN